MAETKVTGGHYAIPKKNRQGLLLLPAWCGAVRRAGALREKRHKKAGGILPAVPL